MRRVPTAFMIPPSRTAFVIPSSRTAFRIAMAALILFAALILSGCAMNGVGTAVNPPGTESVSVETKSVSASPGETSGTVESVQALSGENSGAAESASTPTPVPPTATPTPDPVETMLASMTLAEKVGQLFIIRPEQIDPFRSTRLEAVRSVMDPSERMEETVELTAPMRGMLERYPAGGFILFAKNIRSPEQVTAFNAALTRSGKVIPFLAVDEEGGRVARIANHSAFDVPKFKSMWAVGSTGDPEEARKAGSVIGEYLHAYGFNLNLAPDADLTTDPNAKSSGIGDRAFGSDPYLVAQMDRAFLDGLHQYGVLGTLKHFPGHGDTSGDTHNDSVLVRKSWEALLSCELIPFTANFDRADMIMISHVTAVNAVSDGMPSTLSWELLTGKLRNELGYDGLLITDGMEMGAIVNHYTSAKAAVMALESGVDLILIPQDYPAAFEGILTAVWTGRIPESRIDQSVRRILNVKFRLMDG